MSAFLPKRSRRAFTMIEALAGILVASIALVIVPTTLRIAGRATMLARDGTAAIGLAQAKIEELLAQGASSVKDDDAVAGPGTPTTFTRTWRVDPISPPGKLRRLSTSVEWNQGEHHLTLETYAWTP